MKKIMENTELLALVNDYGGGRKKEGKKSQLFYDLAKTVLLKFHQKSYSEIEMFAEYLKEVGKSTSVHQHFGIEPQP